MIRQGRPPVVLLSVAALLLGAGVSGPGLAEIGDPRPPAPRPVNRAPSPPQPNLSPRAAVVTDVRCDRLVEPFELTDNLTRLAKLTVETGVQSLMSGNLPSGQAKIPPSTKLAAKGMNWMPIEWEKMYGDDLHKKRTDVLPNSRRMADFYKQGNDVLKRILAQIHEAHAFEFKLFVTNDSQVNAEAYPGGYLYVSKEAFVRGTEYVEFALAHEISHVTKRHTTKEVQARLIDSVTTLGELKKLMGGPSANPLMVVSYGRFLHGHFLRYSRDQELQADACGIRMLSGISEIDARKASGAFLKELKEDQKGNGGFQGHVSTHPGYPERKQRIELLLAHYSRKPPR